MRWLVLICGLAVAALVAPARASAAVWTETTPQIFFPNFYAVSSSYTGNVWAVGENDADRSTPVAERWNGTSWTAHSPALTFPNDGGLFGVAALSARNVWAVGWQHVEGSTAPPRTLAEHWTGSSWHVVATPASSTSDRTLYAVSAVSAADIWAVGSSTSTSDARITPLVEHWNGSAWKVVGAPGTTGLVSVEAVNARNVWAVGGNAIEHYNGSSWRVAGFSLPSTVTLEQVNRVPGTRHLWAVGTDTASGAPVAVYYTGSRWVRRDPPVADADLGGVAARSESDVWASGKTSTDGNLTVHWTGSAWHVVTPAGLADGWVMNMASSPAGSQLFAVGYLLDGSGPFAAFYH